MSESGKGFSFDGAGSANFLGVGGPGNRGEKVVWIVADVVNDEKDGGLHYYNRNA